MPIYLDVLGRWLPRLPQSWALPLSIAAFAADRAGRLSDAARAARRSPPPLAGGADAAVAAGRAVSASALCCTAWRHGFPAMPIRPLPIRFGCACRWRSASLRWRCWRRAVRAPLPAGCGWRALAIVCAIWAPGLTPYFLFPSLVAAPLLLATVRGDANLPWFVAALAALVDLARPQCRQRSDHGAEVHPLFTVTAAFALMTLLPLLATAQGMGLVAGAVAGAGDGPGGDGGLAAGFQRRSAAAAQSSLCRKRRAKPGGWPIRWPICPTVCAPPRISRPHRSACGDRLCRAGRHRALCAAVALVTRQGDIVTLDLKAPGDGVMLDGAGGSRLQSLSVGGVTIAGVRTAHLPSSAAHRIAAMRAASSLRLDRPDAGRADAGHARRHGLAAGRRKAAKAPAPAECGAVTEAATSTVAGGDDRGAVRTSHRRRPSAGQRRDTPLARYQTSTLPSRTPRSPG